MNYNEIYYGVFMYMMANKLLSNQTAILLCLKSVSYVLQTAHGASQSDIESGIIRFCQEYNMGCGNQMSDSYIRNTIVPAVLNYPKVNINVGTEVLEIVFDRIN